MVHVLSVGSLNYDTLIFSPRLPLPGETVSASHYLEAPGGKGANQAFAAARLGAKVRMLGCVGSDPYGSKLVEALQDAGCDVSGVKVLNSATGRATVLVGTDGQNAIIVVAGANTDFSPAIIRSERRCFKRARVVMFQLEIPMETVLAGLQLGRAASAELILDPAPAPEALDPRLIGAADIVTPNEIEAAQLVGPRRGDNTIEDARALAHLLQERLKAKVIALKLGERGCVLADGKAAYWIRAPMVVPVDTSGAGDTFNGALAAARAEGMDMIQACRFAVHAAALSVTKPSAQTAPLRAELVLQMLPPVDLA